MKWKGLLKAASLGTWGGGEAGGASLGKGVRWVSNRITFPPSVNFKKKLFVKVHKLNKLNIFGKCPTLKNCTLRAQN